VKSIINLSLASNLALHALKALAMAKGRAMNLKELAKNLECSEHHLSKVMQKLVQSNILTSSRGPKGGFSILDFDVSFWQVLRNIDGGFAEHNCLLNREKCLFGSCLFGSKLDKVSNELRQMLKSSKIKDLG